MAWQSGSISGAFPAATMIQGLLELNDISYVFERWQGTLLAIAITLIAALFNVFLAKHLPKIEILFLVLHSAGFLAILIPLWVLSPRTSASIVFTQFTDGGNWGNMGLSCLVGMLSPIYTLLGRPSTEWALTFMLINIGADSAVHMCTS